MLDRWQKLCAGKNLIVGLALLMLLGGCANNVIVSAEIPVPLIEKLPITGSMAYNDKFKNYVYLEAEKKRTALKSLDLASAQITLFDRVFGALMTLVAPEVVEKDLVIEPEILDFQYSSPSETKVNQYEVWIKYRLKLTNDESQKLADWTIKGYGKTPTGLLKSASSAFNAAATVALRDVGAQLSIRFAEQRTIKQLVDGETPEPIAEPELIEEQTPESAAETTKGTEAKEVSGDSLEDTEGSPRVAESSIEMAEGSIEMAEGSSEMAEEEVVKTNTQKADPVESEKRSATESDEETDDD